MGKQLFDQYTLLHIAVGVVAYFWGLNIVSWLILHTIFEIIENTEFGIKIINKYITFWPGGKPYADYNINIFGDTFGALIGWGLAYYLDKFGEKQGWYVAHLKK